MKDDISLKDKVFTSDEIENLEDFMCFDNGNECVDAVNISRAVDGALDDIDIAVNAYINRNGG